MSSWRVVERSLPLPWLPSRQALEPVPWPLLLVRERKYEHIALRAAKEWDVGEIPVSMGGRDVMDPW